MVLAAVLPVRATALAAAALAAAVCGAFVAPAAQPYEVRVNCGGPTYTGAGGTLFRADQAYAGQGWGHAGGWPQDLWCPIGGSADSVLYRTTRFGHNTFHYRFDVPSGSYEITLRFSEVNAHWYGLTVMRVAAEGVVLLDSLDIFAEVERAYALDARFRIAVLDGRLDLDFVPLVDGAQVAAIEVLSAAPVPGPPPAPAAPDVVPGYGCMIVDWRDSPDRDLKGFELVRRRLPEGSPEVVRTPQFLTSRCIDSAVEPGAEYAYQVRAFDLDGLASAASPWSAGRVLRREESALADYEIVATEENLRLLNRDIYSEQYVPAAFVYDAHTWTDVGVRYRGESNRESPKKNWKIRFYGQLCEDQNRINLNSGYADPSMVREALGFHLAERAGGLSCATRRVNLYLNGQHRGIHTQIEQIDEGWLERRGLPEDSPVFKCGDGLNYWHPAVYPLYYEREVGPADDLTPIEELIDLITFTPEQEFPDSIARVLDMYDFMRWYAFQIIYSNQDFATHNYYLVQNADTERWSFVPWDLDVTLGCATTYVHDYDALTPIDMGTVAHPDVRGANALIERLLRHECFRWMFAQTVLELVAGPLSAEGFLDAYDAHLAEIDADVAADYHKWGWESRAHHDEDAARSRIFIRERCAFLIEEAEHYQPALDFGLRLNEFMAANETTIADEHGEFEDWIEILNVSDHPVGLGGLRLSDDLHRPRVWTFPDTTLGPGDYLLVWADEEPGQGMLHATFKLNRNGEALALWAGDAEGNVLIDHVVFGPQVADISLGRIPDGWGDWQALTNPSPGGPNSLPASVAVGDGRRGASAPQEPARPVVRVTPTPATRRATVTWVNPRRPGTAESDARLGAERDRLYLSILDVQGRVVGGLVLRADHPEAELDLSDFPRPVSTGVYWIWAHGPGGSCRPVARMLVGCRGRS
jgi:spore coat protein H